LISIEPDSTTMTRSRRRPRALTEYVIERRLWGDAPFSLIDVGCSGGIASRWRVFRERLRAVGFDPLVAEIERLNAANEHPGVTYEAALVTCRDYDALFPHALRCDVITSKNNQPFDRTSAAAADRGLQTSYIQQFFNSGAPIVLTDRSVVLDDYVAADERGAVDFVKIDTDGHDIEVILGAEAIMRAGGILGFMVEAQFHGPLHDFANTFTNIDRIVRQHGFTLFDLPAYRYSRAELPAPFLSDRCAQTTSGQIMWAKAVYFRDLGSTHYDRMWSYEVTPERVMKLACLFELFNLSDCAAELLQNRGSFLDEPTRAVLFDLLVSGEPGSYAALTTAFNTDVTQFYPSRRHSVDPEAADVVDAEAGDHRVTSSQAQHIDKLEEKIATLRNRLKERDAQLAYLRQRVSELKGKRTQKADASR
jgi:FkbM family methyltransferase